MSTETATMERANRGNTTGNRYRGHLVTWKGKTMVKKDWAAHFGVTPCHLSVLIKDCGGIVTALEHLAKNSRQKNSGRGLRRKVVKDKYIYTGPEFVSPSGETVTPGTSRPTLKAWGELLGIGHKTISNRIWLLRDQDGAFNAAISSPLSKSIPGVGCRRRALRTGGTAKTTPETIRRTVAPGMTTLEILQCRDENPDYRCAPCRRRAFCYGEVAPT